MSLQLLLELLSLLKQHVVQFFQFPFLVLQGVHISLLASQLPPLALHLLLLARDLILLCVLHHSTVSSSE